MALKRDCMPNVTDGLDGGKQAKNRLEETTQMAFCHCLRSRRSLPQSDWSTKVYKLRVSGSSCNSIEVSWPQLGFMGAMIVLSGACVVA